MQWQLKHDPNYLVLAEADRVLAEFLEVTKQKELAELRVKFVKELQSLFNGWKIKYLKWADKNNLWQTLYNDASKKRKVLTPGDKAVIKEADQEININAALKKLSDSPDNKGMVEIVAKYGEQAYNVGGQAVLDQLNINKSFKLKDKRILKKIKDHAYRRSVLSTDNIQARIDSTILKGYYRDGKNPRDMIKDIRELFDNNISKSRAYLIAHQETLVPTMQARTDSFDKSGIGKKKWLAHGQRHRAGQKRRGGKKGSARKWSSSDPRPSHAAASGQIVAAHKPFFVGNAELMFPGDPDGPAREVMRCHCTMVPVVDTEWDQEQAWTGEVDHLEKSYERQTATKELKK
ncbi:MAG TPA: hypothetical protein ENH19_01955 [Actinobacteria bacterium]|nr:hypothetical protein [Actinomycetes bacterium]HEX21400.1 hypothetical protein [Actinomycetota bacterium]